MTKKPTSFIHKSGWLQSTHNHLHH